MGASWGTAEEAAQRQATSGSGPGSPCSIKAKDKATSRQKLKRSRFRKSETK